MSTEHSAEHSAFRLNPDLVTAFVENRLDDTGQAELAEQISQLLPFHPQLPNPVTGRLVELITTLGGDEALLGWLERYPGRPRTTARLYRVIGVLDSYSTAPGVIEALRGLRAHDPYPHDLAGYLVPDTTDYTVASLSQEIEGLLGDGRPAEAVWLAQHALALLADVAPRAAELDERATDLAAQVNILRQAVDDVATPSR